MYRNAAIYGSLSSCFWLTHQTNIEHSRPLKPSKYNINFFFPILRDFKCGANFKLEKRQHKPLCELVMQQRSTSPMCLCQIQWDRAVTVRRAADKESRYNCKQQFLPQGNKTLKPFMRITHKLNNSFSKFQQLLLIFYAVTVCLQRRDAEVKLNNQRGGH